MAKTLNITSLKKGRNSIPDLEVFGNGDTWKLICKSSSEKEQWLKSTKALEIPGCGCLVQVTTQQKNPDGSYVLAEALTFVPRVFIYTTEGKNSYRMLKNYRD